MNPKLAKRYQELFKQTPRAALINQVARDLFENRFASLYWFHLRADFADRLSYAEIAAAAEGAIADYDPRRIKRQVVGTALHEYYVHMTNAQVADFIADVRQALRDRITRTISREQSRDVLGRMVAAGV